MGKLHERGGGVSRRGFLKRAMIGLGGGAAMVVTMGGRGLFAPRRRVAAEFPEDSIFAPAKKRHDRA